VALACGGQRDADFNDAPARDVPGYASKMDSEPRTPIIAMPVSPVTMPPMVAMTPVMAVSPMPAMPHLDNFSTGGTGGHRSLLDHSGHGLGVCRQSEERRRTERENRESCFDSYERPPFCARATSRDRDGSGTNARISANGNILNPLRILRRIGCGRHVVGDSGSSPMPPFGVGLARATYDQENVER
jgi:hypothetical protein